MRAQAGLSCAVGGQMAGVFRQSLRENFDHALRQLAEAIRDCPLDLWEADLWADEAPTTTDGRGAIRGSAPWLLAHHALVCMDYDLAGEFERWNPPPPIGDSILGPDPTRVFSREDLLRYLDHCRSRVGNTLTAMTETAAGRPVPAPHRYQGVVFGVLVGSIPPHVVEHAAQIRQFYR